MVFHRRRGSVQHFVVGGGPGFRSRRWFLLRTVSGRWAMKTSYGRRLMESTGPEESHTHRPSSSLAQMLAHSENQLLYIPAGNIPHPAITVIWQSTDGKNSSSLTNTAPFSATKLNQVIG